MLSPIRPGIYLTSGTARAALAVTEAFGNTGTIIDGDGGGAGSSVTVGGTLTNGGALYLQNGATLSATTGLTNSDYLEVDASGSGGSSLTVGGTLTNKSGYFSIGDSGITVGDDGQSRRFEQFGRTLPRQRRGGGGAARHRGF